MSRVSERRKQNKKEEGGAYWMDTYGDMITLLLTFFVMLFAFSTLDAQKWESFVSAFNDSTPPTVIIPALSLEAVLENPIELEPTSDKAEDTNTDSSVNEDIPGGANMDNFYELYENVSQSVADYELDAFVVADYELRNLTIRFNDSVFFESGSADLLPESRETLDQVLALLLDNIDLIQMVVIEGHTDNVPISNAKYTDNWALASDRANNALRYMMDSEIVPGNKLSSRTYGEQQPVADNSTPEGRAQNRRIDFVVESNT